MPGALKEIPPRKPGCCRSRTTGPSARCANGERSRGTRSGRKAIADEGDTPEVAALKQDKSATMRRCMEALSAEHREIIDLVYYHELSIAEVAAVVGIPENTVKTRMFYARKRLSEILKAAGVDRGWP